MIHFFVHKLFGLLEKLLHNWAKPWCSEIHGNCENIVPFLYCRTMNSMESIFWKYTKLANKLMLKYLKAT